MSRMLARSAETIKHHKNHNIYEILDIDSPQEMSIKARIASSILTIIEHKEITLRNAAGKAKITEKQLKAILSGRFHTTTIFRLTRIKHHI